MVIACFQYTANAKKVFYDSFQGVKNLVPQNFLKTILYSDQ